MRRDVIAGNQQYPNLSGPAGSIGCKAKTNRYKTHQSQNKN
jgi:hypothetical protein